MTRSKWNAWCGRAMDIGLCLLAATFLLWLLILFGYAKEGDDHGNHGELKAWFDGLRSDLGLCCSFADGEVVEDVDYDTQDGHFRVFLDGQWHVIRDEAVIKVPNKFGKAVVWPIRYNGTVYDIRCFMPGAGT